MGLKSFLCEAFGSLKFFGMNHANELLVGGGIFCSVVGFGLAVKEGYEFDDILEDHVARIEAIKSRKDYNEIDDKKAITKEYIKTGVKTVKHFGPALGLEIAGASMIGIGFKREHNAKLEAIAFGNMVNGLYNNYRNGVRNELGEEFDNHFAYGTDLTLKPDKDHPIQTIEDIKNCPKEEKFVEKEKDDGMPSEFARFFDIYNDKWCSEEKYGPCFREHNLMFIRSVINTWQTILNTRGFVFLNEVYRDLGFDMSTRGTTVGWVAKKYGGSGKIDLYLYDGKNPATRRFINGDEDECVLLDFNVDGVISDKLDIIAKDKEKMYSLWNDAIARKNRKLRY